MLLKDKLIADAVFFHNFSPEQKYSKLLVEASILRAKEIPLWSKVTKNYQKWGNYSFHYDI